MAVKTVRIDVNTNGHTDILDLTDQVSGALVESGLTAGTVTVFAPGSTAGISTLEYEPGLKTDIPKYMERIAPYDGEYAHHETWHDDNGASHVRSTLVGPSMTVPFADGQMILGPWQQIVLICFDTRPRRREVVLQFMGE